MKVAIVTWYTYNNYGTQLQAFALQSFLTRAGYESAILDDGMVLEEQRRRRTSYHGTARCEEKGELVLSRIAKAPVRLAMRNIRGFVRSPYYFSQTKFKQFKARRLSVDYDVSPRVLQDVNDRYDVFVCGSDQIWSPIEQNLNGYYYLNFCTKPKVSYATSLGMNAIPDDKLPQIKGWLRSFNSISVREKHNVKQIADITGIDVALVADPTLLMGAEWWSRMCRGAYRINRDYILCYFLESSEWYFDLATQLAKAQRMPLVLIPSRLEHTNRNICLRHGIGPLDFVSLVKDARLIVTDSYHGSVFSTVFSKQFYYFKRFDESLDEGQNVRVSSLFHELGLIDRIIQRGGALSNHSGDICYKETRERLLNFRLNSARYLLKAMSSLA